jgi:predicted transcriptional regulator of viral defense system
MSPDAALAQFAARHHSVFSLAHAHLLRFSRKQIHWRRRRGLWLPVYLGAYRLEGAPVTWKGKLLAACWAGGFRAVASHRSAAAMYGLAGGRRPLAEITCPRWQRARHPEVQVHESKALGPLDVTLMDEIPVTTPEVTLLTLGAVCHTSIVEMALDKAERTGLVTPSSLRSVLARLSRRGRNGAGVLRRIIDERSPERTPAESEMETLMLQVLRRSGLPEPIPQYELRQGGTFIARVDAAYPQWRIALEYDSYEWHSGRLAQDRDTARRMRIQAAGWFPISVAAAELWSGGNNLVAAIRGTRERSSDA